MLYPINNLVDDNADDADEMENGGMHDYFSEVKELSGDVAGDKNSDGVTNDNEQLYINKYQRRLQQKLERRTRKDVRIHVTKNQTNHQKFLDNGFSFENATLAEEVLLIDTNNLDGKSKSAMKVITDGLNAILESATDITTEKALEQAQKNRKNICVHFDT